MDWGAGLNWEMVGPFAKSALLPLPAWRNNGVKIILTGSSGFIGRNIYENWSNKYQILAPTHQELDLTNSEAVKRYLQKERPDVVLHTANTNELVHPERSPYVMELNLRMFFNLANCNDCYGKMLYFGSGAEYDRQHYIPHMSESYFGTYIPEDAYGFSKYIMSRTADSSHNIFNLRLFGVFGKYEEWERRFISNLIYLYLTGQPMRMGPNMQFDYLYVQDLLPIVEWFLHHSTQYHSYNVCSGKSVDLYSIGCIICDLLGLAPSALHKESGWKPPYTGDNARLLNEIGPQFSLTPMRIAIQQLINYYIQNAPTLWNEENTDTGQRKTNC